MEKKPLLVYDGFCNLCTNVVKCLYAFDKGRRIEYVPHQYLNLRILRKHGLTTKALQGSLHLITESGSVSSGASAIAEVCATFLPLRAIGVLMNNAAVSSAYDWLARKRAIFGCRDKCYFPRSTFKS